MNGEKLVNTWEEAEQKNEVAKKRLNEFADKWWLWKNGLRFKIVNEVDEYGEWIAEDAKGYRWVVRPWVMVESEAIELTEEEAKFHPIEIEQDVIRVVMCGTCCGWKCGKEELRIKMQLETGEIPLDEQDRVQDALRSFFTKYSVEGVVPYVYRTSGGIEISFISTKNEDEIPKPKELTEEEWSMLEKTKLDILRGKNE
jgi:hypothetical protein